MFRSARCLVASVALASLATGPAGLTVRADEAPAAARPALLDSVLAAVGLDPLDAPAGSVELVGTLRFEGAWPGAPPTPRDGVVSPIAMRHVITDTLVCFRREGQRHGFGWADGIGWVEWQGRVRAAPAEKLGSTIETLRHPVGVLRDLARRFSFEDRGTVSFRGADWRCLAFTRQIAGESVLPESRSGELYVDPATALPRWLVHHGEPSAGVVGTVSGYRGWEKAGPWSIPRSVRQEAGSGAVETVITDARAAGPVDVSWVIVPPEVGAVRGQRDLAARQEAERRARAAAEAARPSRPSRPAPSTATLDAILRADLFGPGPSSPPPPAAQRAPVECRQCGGSGVRPCYGCRGTGYVEGGLYGRTLCRSCSGQGTQPCPH